MSDKSAQTAQSDRSHLRKRLIATDAPAGAEDGHLVIGDRARLAYSCEDPAHPVENLFDGRDGPGGTYWASARADVTEHLILEFDEPQSIARLTYEVEETRLDRAQEVRVEVSADSGKSYRQLIVQEYAFSPRGATFQHEDLRLNVAGVTHMRLTIVPHKNGSGTATLTSLRLFA
jgi:F5/8 type C domain